MRLLLQKCFLIDNHCHLIGIFQDGRTCFLRVTSSQITAIRYTMTLPPSDVRTLATSVVAFLHVARSLAARLTIFIVGPFMVLVCLAILFSRLLALSSHSFPLSSHRSCLTTCPKYLDAACVTPDSDVRSGLVVFRALVR